MCFHIAGSYAAMSRIRFPTFTIARNNVTRSRKTVNITHVNIGWIWNVHRPVTIIFGILEFHYEIHSDCTALPKHTLVVWLTTTVGMTPSFHPPIHRRRHYQRSATSKYYRQLSEEMQLYLWHSRRLCALPSQQLQYVAITGDNDHLGPSYL
jgi:hypothetical protein